MDLGKRHHNTNTVVLRQTQETSNVEQMAHREAVKCMSRRQNCSKKNRPYFTNVL